MFNARKILDRRLPDAPSPACPSCAEENVDVRPFGVEPLGPGALYVLCLGRCRCCGANLIGKRTVGIKNGQSRFLDQSFELYDPRTHGEQVRKMAENIAANRDKLEQINSRPVLD